MPWNARTALPSMDTAQAVDRRERNAPLTVLGLDDLITTKLDSLDEVGDLLSSLLEDAGGVGLLGEQGDDGDA